MKKPIRFKIPSVLFFFFASVILFYSAGFCADIVIYGDSQSDYTAQARVVESIMPFRPAIVFRVGDIVEDGDDPKQWELFREVTRPLLNSTEYFPALGNHDKGSRLYFHNFPVIHNQRWYSVERMGIHFTVLDSNSDLRRGSEQYRWLESDLSKAGRETRFRVVLLHHPLYSVGFHRKDEKGLRPILVPLFSRYGVGLVFSGHDHNYQRFMRDGIYYIVTGGGGSKLHDQTRESPYLNKFSKTHHFCLLSPAGDNLKVSVFDADLNKLDEFDIRHYTANPFEREAAQTKVAR